MTAAPASLPTIPLLPPGGRLCDIPVAAIHVARCNPRTDAEETLESLAASLSAGLVQFPTVIAVSGDEYERYELIDGERRWRAAQAAGLTTLPCLVREPGSPAGTLFTQVLANLHRQDLGPLDESAALKASWLVLNAHALDLSDQADAILADAAQLRAALAPLRALIDAAGWNWREPQVSQAVFVEYLGLGITAAALKKKLGLLNATDALQDAARQHGLTAAAIRALMTLDRDDQDALLAALDAAPELAKQVRTIVQGVRQKGRTMAEQLAIIQGHALDGDGDVGTNRTSTPLSPVVQALADALPPGALSALLRLPPEVQDDLVAAVATQPELTQLIPLIVETVVDDGESLPEAIRLVMSRDPDDLRDAAVAAEASAAAAPPPAPAGISDEQAMDAVLPLIELAQDLDGRLRPLRAILGDPPTFDALPPPWGDYAREAFGLIVTTIHPYTSS